MKIKMYFALGDVEVEITENCGVTDLNRVLTKMTDQVEEYIEDNAEPEPVLGVHVQQFTDEQLKACLTVLNTQPGDQVSTEGDFDVRQVWSEGGRDYMLTFRGDEIINAHSRLDASEEWLEIGLGEVPGAELRLNGLG